MISLIIRTNLQILAQTLWILYFTRLPWLNITGSIFYKYLHTGCDYFSDLVWNIFEVFLGEIWQRLLETEIVPKSNMLLDTNEILTAALVITYIRGFQITELWGLKFYEQYQNLQCWTKPWQNTKWVQLVPREQRHLIRTPQQEQALHTGSSKTEMSHEELKSRKIIRY